MNDKTLGACQCHEKHAPTYWKGVVREYKEALDKAEQERDHFQEVASTFRAKFNEADARAEQAEQDKEWWIKRTELFSQMYHGTLLRQKAAEQPRPLTPDAITDEMVERGAIANWRGDVAHPDWTFEDISDEDRGWYRDNARAVLTAALTEPPARPEGAEDIEALIRDLLGSHPGDWYGDLADHLAAHLTDPTRKEA